MATQTGCLFLLAITASFPVHSQEDRSELIPTTRIPNAGYTAIQLTTGPLHHFFGYIGHAGNIPWNASERYMLALRTPLQDRLPGADDAADVVLLDSNENYAVTVVDQTHAWNPQQGTMFYWNPKAPETQFFFNDRDRESGEVFTVLYDLKRRRRVREFRFAGSPVANSGVAQRGGQFLAINYARLSRLRPVTGYAEATDWTSGIAAPEDDGLFVVDVDSGKRRLLASYARLRDELPESLSTAGDPALFINHTLWSRDDSRIYFYLRANFKSRQPRVDVPLTVDLAGNLTRHRYIGGHPEWANGKTLIGSAEDRQVLYDVDQRRIVGGLGEADTFPNPGGDIALAPDGRLFVNGSSSKRPPQNVYTFLHRGTGKVVRTTPFSRGRWISGALRVDPAPCWDRRSEKVVIPAIADDGTRQMFLIRLGDRLTAGR